jgi:hypothetical protein
VNNPDLPVDIIYGPPGSVGKVLRYPKDVYVVGQTLAVDTPRTYGPRFSAWATALRSEGGPLGIVLHREDTGFSIITSRRKPWQALVIIKGFAAGINSHPYDDEAADLYCTVDPDPDGGGFTFQLTGDRVVPFNQELMFLLTTLVPAYQAVQPHPGLKSVRVQKDQVTRNLVIVLLLSYLAGCGATKPVVVISQPTLQW